MEHFFSLGFDHLIHDSCFTVPLTGLLGVSHEKFHWRMGLFHFHLLAGYGNFGNTTSIFFHCHLSLHLPFKWEFSIQIQSESQSEYIFFLHFLIRIPDFLKYLIFYLNWFLIPLFISTWFLKSLVWKIQFNELDFLSILN